MKVIDSSKEIIIKYNDLAAAVEDLRGLEAQIRARKLNISFQKTKGALSDEMISMADSLQNVGLQLARVIGQTAQWMENGGSMFEQADGTGSSAFGG